MFEVQDPDQYDVWSIWEVSTCINENTEGRHRTIEPGDSYTRTLDVACVCKNLEHVIEHLKRTDKISDKDLSGVAFKSTGTAGHSIMLNCSVCEDIKGS